MFTGIVEETGRVHAVEPTTKSVRLQVQSNVCASRTRIGDSIAVNGCCLTVTQIARRRKYKILSFDLLKETWERTNLQFVLPGSLVNLERALRADSRIGGHFVTGHVDETGKILRWERSGADYVLEIAASKQFLRYIIFKGSIAVDGISLTIAAVEKNFFRIWIIPHTFEMTALRDRKVGDKVNLEADLLGKYVEQFISRKSL